MYKFMIVVEKTDTGYSAYSPDLPGCVATGETKEETEQNIYNAIEMHIEGLKEDGLPIPEPTTFSEYVLISDRMVNAI
jgi:predicted RNase H-like HicB family nuclease